jgi:hypothetical protein
LRACDSPANAASRFFSVCVPAYLFAIKTPLSDRFVSNIPLFCELLRLFSKTVEKYPVFRIFAASR